MSIAGGPTLSFIEPLICSGEPMKRNRSDPKTGLTELTGSKTRFIYTKTVENKQPEVTEGVHQGRPEDSGSSR